jgi:hypothetical protein
MPAEPSALPSPKRYTYFCAVIPDCDVVMIGASSKYRNLLQGGWLPFEANYSSGDSAA